ncbi:uncharacterized protein LOC106464563, partial [Limulus polyphemus]|uniref:Uncharacterized protein LOC106464563 n=1 Tax=Limulus polyphemus TaxID=6850 RepID=A0ABM1SWK3_LIMPO
MPVTAQSPEMTIFTALSVIEMTQCGPDGKCAEICPPYPPYPWIIENGTITCPLGYYFCVETESCVVCRNEKKGSPCLAGVAYCLEQCPSDLVFCEDRQACLPSCTDTAFCGDEEIFCPGLQACSNVSECFRNESSCIFTLNTTMMSTSVFCLNGNVCPQNSTCCPSDGLPICITDSGVGLSKSEVPVPIEARFKDTLDAVDISFTTALTPQGPINCFKVFDQFSLSLLGQGPSCVSIADTLTIYLGEEPALTPGNIITLRSGNDIYNRDKLSEKGFEATGMVSVENAVSPLKENAEYVVLLTARNRLGAQTYIPTVHTVRRTSKSLALTLVGPTLVNPHSDVTFTVLIDVCASVNLTSSKLQFLWSTNSSDFSLAAFTGRSATVTSDQLTSGRPFVVSVTVSVNGSDILRGEVNRLFVIKKTSLRPWVDPETLVVGNETSYFLLKGTPYLYTNLNTLAMENILLDWSCHYQMANTSCLNENVTTNEQMLTIHAGMLKPNRYNITFKATRNTLGAEKQMNVIVLPGNVPVVYVKRSYVGPVSPTDRYVVNAYVTSDVDVRVWWECVVEKEYATSSLEGITPSSHPRNYSGPLIRRPFPLLIPSVNTHWRGLLGGGRYKFRLVAEPINGGERGYADIIVETNQPPITGGLEVTPPSGIAFQTTFTLKATGRWSDEPQDYPLKYTFFYQVMDEEFTTPINVFIGEPPGVQNVFLPGDSRQSSNVTVAVKVCGGMSCSIAKQTVPISPSAISGEECIDKLSGQAATLLNEGDITQTLATVRAAALLPGNQSETLFHNTVNAVAVNTLLTMESLQLTTNSTTSNAIQMINDVESYLAGMCQYLVVGEEPATAATSIVAVRSEKLEFDLLAGKAVILASLNSKETNQVNLGAEIVETYSSWLCLEHELCYSACVGSAEVKSDIATLAGGETLRGSLILLRFFNPLTGHQMALEPLLIPMILTVPVENIEVNEGETLVLTTTTIQPPEAPRPITARFADSLDNVLITLSDSVRPEGLINCSDVFNKTSLELLGEDPMCVSIANTLTVQLGREPDLIPDDSLTFLSGNGLYNRDVPSELGSEVTGTVTVEEALSPFTPYFDLFGPREVCGRTINITVIDVTADACYEMDYFRSIFPIDTS